MNRERDFDQTLKHWLDDGAEQAPERFVWAALEDTERIAQRGAWQVSLEGLFMKLKTAAPYLGIAAVIVLAIAAYQVFVGPNIGNPTPSPSPTPRLITPADLPEIVLSSELPPGWALDSTVVDRASIIVYPTRSAGAGELATGAVGTLIGGRANEFTGPPDSGIYTSWVALFETREDAQRALEIYLADFESVDAWGLTPAALPALGDEGHLFSGSTRALGGPPSGEAVPAQIYVWRVGSLLLAAAGFFDYDATTLQSVALGMDARAH